MKRQHSKASSQESDPDVPAPLAAYGERFMSMFDDYDEQQGKSAKQARLSKQQQQQQPSSRPKPSAENSSEAGTSKEAAERLTSHAAASAPADAPAAALSKSQRKKHKAAAAAAAAAAVAAVAVPPVGDSKLDAFLSKRKGLNSRKVAQAPSQAQIQAQQQQQEQQRLLERQLKKQFMSCKVSKIFNDVDASQLEAAAAAGKKQQLEEASLSPEEFAQMRRDVELLGASALDKRAAKAWKASMLARLGASADKAPRTPAKVGIGMAKKAKQREAVALQEAIAAGMVQAKGRGKKARALKAKQRDKGLLEAGPGFKNGVLRLSKSMKPQQQQQQQQR